MKQVYNFLSLPILNFRMVLMTGNIFWLLTNYDGQEKEVSHEVEFELHNLWNKIFIEYLDEVDDPTTKRKMKKMARIKTMKLDYAITYNLMKLYSCKITNEARTKIETMINAKGFELHHKANTDAQTDVILNELKMLKTTIADMELSINGDGEKPTKTNTKRTIYQECANIEQVLDLKYGLDPAELVCPKFIGYLKAMELKSKMVA